MSRGKGIGAGIVVLAAAALAAASHAGAAPTVTANCAHGNPPASLPPGPDDLVVGPLRFVGIRGYANANLSPRPPDFMKSPALVRRGHTVTVRVAQPQPRTTGILGYGRHGGTYSLAASRASVTFTACHRGHRSEGISTWWSGGFVEPSAPTCVPLDIYVDHSHRARHVVLSFGAGTCPAPPR